MREGGTAREGGDCEGVGTVREGGLRGRGDCEGGVCACQ